MIIRFQRLCEQACVPTKAHPTDAGFDLVVTSKQRDEYGNVVYGFGLATEIPEGFAGFLFPRSSNSKKDLILTNCVGVIDCHFRGEIKAKFRPNKPWWRHCKEYELGDRACQLIILQTPSVDWDEADSLTTTDRGVKSYGSSGA